jgi:hypothetical protein
MSAPLQRRQQNSFDPSLVTSESESDNPPSSPTKTNPPVPPAPKLASRPAGKLARHRQNIRDILRSPTPTKAVGPWLFLALTDSCQLEIVAR